MRITRLTLVLPLAGCALATGVVAPATAHAAYGGASSAVCEGAAYWQFSGVLGVSATSGTVSQWYDLPDVAWEIDTVDGSHDPVCETSGADAWYSVGQVPVPVPVDQNGRVTQQQGDGQATSGPYSGTCAEATVWHQFNQPSQVGYLIGGSVYIGYPNTISSGTNDAGAWTEVDVLAAYPAPCITNIYEGAGVEGGGYAYDGAP